MHTPRTSFSRLAAALGAAGLLTCSGFAAAASDLVISQIYGGNGYTYKSDYVELFNRGNAAVNVTGWSVQYASAIGTGNFSTNSVTSLSGSVQPGQYLLVRLATSSTGTALPTPDATGTTNLSASSGKVIVAKVATGLACNGGSTPCSATQMGQIADLVGYGSANFYEGASAAPAASSTLALFRAGDGCSDTDNNGADFTTATPVPRNSTSPLKVCASSPVVTPVAAIQGSGISSPIVGQTVTTSGVVTAVFPNLKGFYLQDPVGDGTPATSDGILVFVNSATMPAGVVAGNQIRLTGTVTEYDGQTELSSPTAITVLATGQQVAPIDIVLPEAVNGELERYEGTLVRIASPMTVAQNYFLGRYGQLSLAANGRLEKATNRHPAGSAEAIALANENQRRLLVLDDGSSLQNPSPTPYLAADSTVRAGDAVSGFLVGILDQGRINSAAALDYRLHPVETPVFTPGNPRTPAPESVPGNVKVASFNVLNYFNGNGNGGGFPTTRGASTLEEFERQRTKIISALNAVNADVVGLMEIENDGYGSKSAIQDLVNGLNAEMGAGTYAPVPDPVAGTGTDEIKVTMIYKPARLTRVGASLSDPDPINNRPPLAQTFAALGGEKFSLVVNHFKSKSCTSATGADLDQGDGQGCYNAQRIAQAQQLLDFIGQVKTAAGDEDVLVIGDLNSYGKEDPVLALTASGLTDQIAVREASPYSYVFDSELGYLDHALSTASLNAQVAGVTHWHINADEPSFLDYNLEFKQPACPSCGPDLYTPTAYRSSDHDPVVVGLQLVK